MALVGKVKRGSAFPQSGTSLFVLEQPYTVKRKASSFSGSVLQNETAVYPPPKQVFTKPAII